MNREAVKSSNLKFVGYSPGAKILTVEFYNGRVYQYENVSKETYKALLEASSKGKYFNELIKGKYTTTRVETGK